MSFLRNIRNNLTNHGHHNARHAKSKPSTARSVISERGAATPNRHGGSNDRLLASNNESERDRSGYATYGGRRDSGTADRRNSNSATLRREGKYGKENPAPIIVFVDKYETVKKPAGILRNNTFTKGDQEKERRSENPISRSDTFTIKESEDKDRGKTNTYTKKKNKEKSQENVFDPLYSKNIELNSNEKLPVVVDSRTYRKKSLKSSNPVHKVESFIKRFEKSLFKHDSKKHGRKDSNSSDGTYVPQFRDVGISCKLDDEDKQKTRKKRQGSRDSLLETTNLEHSSSSQRSYKERSHTPQTKHRERSNSSTKKYSPYDRKEDLYERRESPAKQESPRRTHERSSSPFETLELKSKHADNSYLKARQKEIEMGYSTVNKKAPSTLTRARSPDHNKSILVNTTRTERYDGSRGRSFAVTTSTHKVEFDRSPNFRSDTYNTLKEEYEQANRKPVGIASPRLNSDRPKHESSISPSKQIRKDSAELPKYTFGTNLQERRSRFQEFQKSFKKMDDKTAEVTYQQSFFVPI